MKLKAVTLLVLLLGCGSEVETRRLSEDDLMARKFYGISAFAGMNPRFPADRFMKQYPRNIKAPAIAFLCGSFGWDWTLFKAFTAKFADRPHLVEFHISNGPGRRNGKLADGAYAIDYNVTEFNKAWEHGGNSRLHDELNVFINRIFNAVTEFGNENTWVLISPELEDNMSDKAFNAFLAAIDGRLLDLEQRRSTRSVCTGGGDISTVHFKEVHGIKMVGARQVGNLDGVSVYVGDDETYFNRISVKSAAEYLANSKGFATFLWSATQQGVPHASGWSNGWPAPKRRTFVVTDKAIRKFKELLRAY